MGDERVMPQDSVGRPSTTATRDIISLIERLAGHPLNRDEGVHHGDAARPIRRVLVCWMATCAALEAAGEGGYDLVLTHESLYYPYNAAVNSDNPPGWQDWPTNRARRELLARHNLVLLRAHGSLDEVCIYDDFAALLGLGAPEATVGLAKVYAVPPRPLGELVRLVQHATGLGAVRVSAPRGMGQVVQRVGLPWGGLGLFVNVGYQQKLIAQGCDVLVAGESDDYGFRFAAECGIPMIETGHAASENPGLKHWARILAEHMPGLDVGFHEVRDAWDVVTV